MNDFTCPACSHAASVACNPAEVVLKCDECGARIAYGTEVQPRVVIQPHKDKRFVVLQVTHHGKDPVEHVVDKDLGMQIGRALASISR